MADGAEGAAHFDTGKDRAVGVDGQSAAADGAEGRAPGGSGDGWVGAWYKRAGIGAEIGGRRLEGAEGAGELGRCHAGGEGGAALGAAWGPRRR